MKKFFSLFIMLTVAVTVVACGNGKAAEPNVDAPDSDSTVPNIVEVTPVLFDSVVYSNSNKWLEYNVYLVYPKGGTDEVIRNMRKVILSNFGEKNPTGDEDFAQVLRKTYESHSAEAKSELEELYEDADFSEDDSKPRYTYEDAIRLDYESTEYVTFFSSGYDYRAGAHGMPWQYRFSVDLNTGRQIKWADMFKPGYKAKLKPIIKKALLDQYFENDEIYIDRFDLPGAEPALTLEGVWFGYGAYEIAAFAAGMPECVVGYDKLYDLFTDYAKMIIKK